MQKWFVFTIAAALALTHSSAFAKRSGPKEVAPVAAKGVIYKVPHFGFFHGKSQNGGFVQAWDAKTEKVLWDRMVYRIIYDPRMEKDVQDVFITKILIVGNNLLVTNEASEEFEMDILSGRVLALTPLGDRREVPELESNR